jgi:hypothetical protein
MLAAETFTWEAAMVRDIANLRIKGVED